MLRKLILGISLIFIVALAQIDLTRALLRSSVSDVERLINAQAEYQTLAIGSYGPPSLFIRLVADKQDFAIAHLKVVRGDQLLLEKELATGDSLGELATISYVARLGDLDVSGDAVPTSRYMWKIGAISISLFAVLFILLRVGSWLIRFKIERDLVNQKFEIATQVAHDIRSPLSAINLVMSTMEAASPQADILRASSKRLEKIAEDVLKRSALKADQALPAVGEVVRQIVKEFRPQFVQHDIKVVGECDASSPPQLDRIIGNLIRNSVEASPNGGMIECKLTQTDRFCEVSILDEGVGFSQSVLALLGKKGVTTKNDGHGLGLYAAKRSVEKFGGKIQFAQRTPRGAEVRIRFPKKTRFAF